MTTKQDVSADFRYKSNYIDVHGSRMHYVDDCTVNPVLKPREVAATQD